ncbi:MAG: erythromycin esterase family protein [Gemmatimonadales bacterium]
MAAFIRSVRGFAFGALVAIAVGTHPSAADAQDGGRTFEHWAATHAAPIRTVEPGDDTGDLRRLGPVIGSARAVALGEPAHGAHEPLAFRNRLFRYLVEELGFTAIAIESGLPESRRVQDFVAGGPGDTKQVVRDNLTYGFGGFEENEELVRWIRDYNANPAHRRKVGFYGIDLSLDGPGESTPTPAALEAAISYLLRVDPVSAQRLRARVQSFIGRLPEAESASFSTAEHDALSGAIDDLISLLEREGPALIAATSRTDYEWAHRNAIVARQAEGMFRVVPPDVAGGGVSPAAGQAINRRDAAMAANVLWVLAQEGPAGRVLVFAHNAHVMNARLEGGIWSAFARPPSMMGQSLRSALGDDLVIIGTSSAQNGVGLPAATPNRDGVDAALARVGLPRFLLDLRAAPADRALTAWFTERRALRANFTTYLTLPLGAAFDAIFFVDTLTPAHTARP